jgi:hypothetical protein
VPSVKRRASKISERREALAELTGKAVALTGRHGRERLASPFGIGHLTQSALLSDHSNQDEKSDLCQESGAHNGDRKERVARW